MELGSIPFDQYAGYVEDDSELEYSECSGDESSGDEGAPGNSKRGCPSSEDEFEQAMESELIGNLELLVSPTVMQAVRKNSAEKAGSTVTKVGLSQLTSVASLSSRAGGTGSGSEEVKESVLQAEAEPSGLFDREDQSLLQGVHEASTSRGQRDGGKEKTKDKREYYDNVYFDSSGSSGEDETREGEGLRGEEGQKRKKLKRKVQKLTNDELFYDPDMDEEDEKWVARQRMAYHNVKVSRHLEHKKRVKFAAEVQGGSQPESDSTITDKSSRTELKAVTPRSDAILNCPACMTTLCLDCQRYRIYKCNMLWRKIIDKEGLGTRHDTYVNQYRAMFVLNCRIVRDELLKYAPKPDKKARRRKRRKGQEPEGMAAEDMQEETESYNPVRCNECNTEVAVYGKDEVFHFFHVLSSAP